MKKYNQFIKESKDINNSDYLELSDILQNEFFDEYNISSGTNEIELLEQYGEFPNHKFWLFENTKRTIIIF